MMASGLRACAFFFFKNLIISCAPAHWGMPTKQNARMFRRQCENIGTKKKRKKRNEVQKFGEPTNKFKLNLDIADDSM